MRRALLADDEIAEILVFGDEDAVVGPGPFKNRSVRSARRHLADPDHVCARLPEGEDGRRAHAFVGQEAHLIQRR
jgi:hypothetical protein